MSYDLVISKPAAFTYRERAIDQLGAAKSFYGVQALQHFLKPVESSMSADLLFERLVEDLSHPWDSSPSLRATSLEKVRIMTLNLH